MVVAFYALSVWVALTWNREWWQRIALFLLAGPVAVLMNIIRVAVLGLFSLLDPELASGQAHTLIGTLLILAPELLIVLLGVFFVVLMLSGFVGLSTMSGAVAMPVFILVTQGLGDQPLLAYATFMAGFIIYCHRSNIERMRAGNENRLAKVMIFKRSAQPGGNGGD